MPVGWVSFWLTAALYTTWRTAFIRSVQVSQQLLRTLRATELSQRSLFDLANSFTRKMQVGTDFSKRLRLPISQPKTPFNDGFFFIVQLAQQRLKLLLKGLRNQQFINRREALVTDQVFKT